MSPVGSSASLGSSIDLDVIDGEVLEVLCIGVRFKVVDEAKDSLD